MGGVDEFGFTEGLDEAVAEEFDGGTDGFGGHAVEEVVRCEKAIGGEEVEVCVVAEVVSELWRVIALMRPLGGSRLVVS